MFKINVLLSSGGVIGIVLGSILLLLILIFLLIYITSFNALNKANIKAEESLSGIDVMLEQRYDLLTKSIQVVKAYAKHESETLEKVINLRKDKNLPELMKFDENLENSFSKLHVIAESYPTLLSSNNYLELQKQIANTEANLAASKRIYNSNVSYLNKLIVNFPTNMFSKKYKKAEFFKVDNIKKQDVGVDL